MWRPRKQWCRRRRLGGGPWSVSASSSSSLPRTCAADSFISAQLNWPAAVVRACPAAPLRAPSRLSLRPIVASVTCGSSKRDGLAAGCSLAGRYVVSYSVAGCSVAGCSVVMRPKCGGWVQVVASQAGLLHEPAPSVNWKCGSEDYVDARAAAMAAYLGRLRACALTAASWLPASTSAHSAPLSSKVSPLLPEPTLTSIRLGCL